MLKNRLTYALAVTLMFLFIYLYESPVTYLGFYTVLILPLISLLVAWLMRRKLSVEGSLSHEFLAKGEEALFKVTFHNASFLPCSFAGIRLHCHRPGLELDEKNHYFFVGAHDLSRGGYPLRGKYRGVYEVAIQGFYFDMLGLFRFTVKKQAQTKIFVVPKILEVPDLELGYVAQNAGTSRRSFSQERGEIAELREFQTTDSYRQIHWKASAKRGQLISKNFEEPQRQAALFLIDNQRPRNYSKGALEMEDAMMDYAVSAMDRCHRLGYPVAIKAMGHTQGYTTDFIRLYEAAATLPFDGQQWLSSLIDDHLRQAADPLHTFVLAQELSEKLMDALQRLKMAGNNVTLLLYAKNRPEFGSRLRSMQIQTIYIENALKQAS